MNQIFHPTYVDLQNTALLLRAHPALFYEGLVKRGELEKDAIGLGTILLITLLGLGAGVGGTALAANYYGNQYTKGLENASQKIVGAVKETTELGKGLTNFSNVQQNFMQAMTNPWVTGGLGAGTGLLLSPFFVRKDEKPREQMKKVLTLSALGAGIGAAPNLLRKIF